MDSKDKIKELKEALKKSQLVDPPEWFYSTMSQGVLWLNTALTFSSVEKSSLDEHTKFWKPIIEEILRVLVTAHENEKDGLVFVLWGGNAKKLKKVIESFKSKCKIKYVEANHPSVESFHQVNTFELVNKYLEELGLEKIDWIPKKDKKRKLEEGEEPKKKK